MPQSQNFKPLSAEDLRISTANTSRALQVFRKGGREALRKYLRTLNPARSQSPDGGR
jgi:hypothetical protein